MLYAPFFSLFQGIFGGCVLGFPLQCCSICTGCPFCIHFWSCFYTGSMDALALRMALHCFLVSFSMYCVLLPTLISVFISRQCLILVFSSVSLSISSISFEFISSCRSFFMLFFVSTGMCTLTFSSSAMSFTCFLHSLCPVLLMSLMRVSVCMLSICFACNICLFITVYFMGMFPVSTSSIVVGVLFGR